MAIDCSPDFFIYVPTLHDAEISSRRDQERDEEVASSKKFGIPLAFFREEWMEIPLEGEFVVYARLSDEQLEKL